MCSAVLKDHHVAGCDHLRHLAYDHLCGLGHVIKMGLMDDAGCLHVSKPLEG